MPTTWRSYQSQEGTIKSLDQEQSTRLDNWAERTFAHHPCIEKHGVWIYRFINTEVTTVDPTLGRLLGRGLMS
jgi:hypothetical protein